MQQTSCQPLAEIRIVDMTHDWAGPHATRMMADYGAEVIKIEYPRWLCGMRGAFLDRINSHPRWWEINRNKGSITLNLHLSERVQAFKDLVRESDVVVDSSRPSVMERFGLGYEVLKASRPDIIMVCMSAYGATGPESSYAGYGGAIEAISGVQSLTAYEREGDRLRIREVDVTNGIMGACAIMTALIARQASGEGQYIDLSQREASTWLIGEYLLEFVINGTQTLPLGNRHSMYAPQGCYRCQGDDRWLVVTIRSDAEWVAFCNTVGHSEWSRDPRFAEVDGRRRHRDEIDRMIESWTASLDNYQAMTILQANGLVAGAVCDCRDLTVDPHLEARG
jgi:crotonobetainyl-CoA:carnitine CoA-transferase CaiB-like acyl-CoA transferase